MLMEICVELFFMPAATKDIDNFWLLANAGQPIFLTYWVLSLQTVYAFANAGAELALLQGLPLPRLLTFNYRSTAFFDTCGIMLTILFLKFNLFEEHWRKNVVELWAKRGHPMYIRCLLGHIPSLFVGLADWITKGGAFRARCLWPYPTSVVVATLTGILYNLWIHFWWMCSGYRKWPYPFLHPLNTVLKRVLLVVVISTFMSFVLLALLSCPSIAL